MKNLLLLLSLFFVFNSAFSQITVEDGALEDGQTYNLPSETNFEISYIVTNTSNSEINYIIEVLDWDGVFTICGGGVCVDLSLATPPAIIGDPTAIAAGASTTVVETHIGYVYGSEGDFITVHVYEEGNETNSVAFTLQTGYVGINDNININDNFISAYPNPAKNYVNFSYNHTSNTNAYITITNVLGKQFKRIDVSNTKGVERVNINNFKSGIYFYTLFVDNKAIISKKLIISN